MGSAQSASAFELLETDEAELLRFSSPPLLRGKQAAACRSQLGAAACTDLPAGRFEKRPENVKLLPLAASTQPAKNAQAMGAQASRLRGDGQQELRVSGVKSKRVPRSFAGDLRKAAKSRRPASVAELLHQHPEVTRSGLLFSGDSECLAVMSEVISNRNPALLSAFFRNGACTPEQIWPSDGPAGQGLSLSDLFSPDILNDASKGTAPSSNLPTACASASPAPSSNAFSGSSSAASPCVDAPASNQYTYVYLPAPPNEKGTGTASVCLGEATRSSQDPSSSSFSSPCMVFGGTRLSWSERKSGASRDSQEGKRILRSLFHQRGLRFGDVVLLDGDSKCISTMLEFVRRPSLFLVVAAAAASADVVEALLRKGANPNRVVHGFSPLNVAASSSQSPHRKVDLLLRYGAAPDYPLLPVASHAVRQAVTSSPAASARSVPTVADSEDLPALMHAVITGDLGLAELLLQQGADPNIFVESLGLPTPLFQAVFWGDLKMVELLCAYGADLQIVKQNGETVFETSNRALKFSLLRKPRHIAQLPLPRVSPARCRQIHRALDDCRLAAAGGRSLSTVEAEVPGGQQPRGGFRVAWESRVVSAKRDRSPSPEKQQRGESKPSSATVDETPTEATTSSDRPVDPCTELRDTVAALRRESDEADIQVLSKRSQSSSSLPCRHPVSPASTAASPPRACVSNQESLSASCERSRRPVDDATHGGRRDGDSEKNSDAASRKPTTLWQSTGNAKQSQTQEPHGAREAKATLAANETLQTKERTLWRAESLQSVPPLPSHRRSQKKGTKKTEEQAEARDASRTDTPPRGFGKGLSLSYSLRDDGSFFVEEI
ncbi:ankyrin repeat-containing protein [Toxoplasma gondii MAS]|uniref:Ankyrin repeat-containing protein n=1 Tax=Toxoplasma gondii MAS TaxID=943118 RepID=A0A086QNE7_TOXGO|nr:ankyrin repeat-containing protein [Toxoplasma gondii MAS]